MELKDYLAEELRPLYEQIERFYVETTGCKPKISFDASGELNETCPAQLMPDDEIKICDRLKDKGLLEAAAHEMGHVILRYQGLIALDLSHDEEAISSYGYHNRVDDLLVEINNSISHNYLISMLQNTFRISSDNQRKLRCGSIEQIRSRLMSCCAGEGYYEMIAHHIEGIIAYDILNCNFENLHYVKQLTEISPEVEKSYDISSEYLTKIHIGQDIDEQIELLRNFFDELGYPATLFKILEPFPKIKSKSKIYCFSTHKE